MRSNHSAEAEPAYAFFMETEEQLPKFSPAHDIAHGTFLLFGATVNSWWNKKPQIQAALERCLLTLTS